MVVIFLGCVLPPFSPGSIVLSLVHGSMKSMKLMHFLGIIVFVASINISLFFEFSILFKIFLLLFSQKLKCLMLVRIKFCLSWFRSIRWVFPWLWLCWVSILSVVGLFQVRIWKCLVGLVYIFEFMSFGGIQIRMILLRKPFKCVFDILGRSWIGYF